MHAIFDEASLQRQLRGQQREATRQAYLDTYIATNKQRRWAEENDIANIERQSGSRMLIMSLEQRVKKLVPSIVFTVKPLTDSQCDFCCLAHGSTLRSMDVLEQDGSHTPIIGFQNQPILPEFTIELIRKKRIPNPHVQNLSMLDVPDTVLMSDGTEDEPKYKWEKALPWEIEVTDPCGTIVGWRSILARLVEAKLSTPELIEAEFGSADRASWANLMGKQKFNVQV